MDGLPASTVLALTILALMVLAMLWPPTDATLAHLGLAAAGAAVGYVMGRRRSRPR